jgi:hypothetical protein
MGKLRSQRLSGVTYAGTLHITVSSYAFVPTLEYRDIKGMKCRVVIGTFFINNYFPIALIES